MSTYVTVQGNLVYKDEESLQKVINAAIEGHWMDSEKYFISESGERISETPDVNGLELTIPFYHYRNLGYWIANFMLDATGKIIWTCLDGCFQGGVITNSGETLYDLDKWAKENMPEETTEPSDDPEQDKINEQLEIETAFFEEMS